MGVWCHDCARFRVTCQGVCRTPGWDGRDGGCGRWTDTLREGGQTTLEAYL